MTKTHLRGRYALAVRLGVVGLRTVVLSLVLAGVMLLCRVDALALDVSQYAHTAWKARDGFPKGQITSIAQTPDGYLWLGSEFGLLPGRAPAEAIEALGVALERGDKTIVEGRDTISDFRQSALGDCDITQSLTTLGKELATQSNNGAAVRSRAGGRETARAQSHAAR